MAKNVKMLFALLATAAVMVGVSFAKDITTPAELVAGEASPDFVLSKDVFLDEASKDETILKAASYEQTVTLDMHGH
ncbi:MAG: hypothetical protein Q4E17_06020, partial [Synergistes sp.]|nr:hypothetical protein [Synergistes sp.]